MLIITSRLFAIRKKFLVISKEKIYAYVVSVFTIITLFMMTGVLNNELNETDKTSSNLVQEEYNNTLSNENKSR